MFIDTHTHIYSKEFDTDRSEAIKRAELNNVNILLLPSIDKSYFERLLTCAKQYPQNCYPMIGLHPTSVNENYIEEINFIKSEITKQKYYAIGETGIDLYWDKTFIKEQTDALIKQIELAKLYNLPLVLHSRQSFNEIYNILYQYKSQILKGVFHCFPGNLLDAEKVINLGFYLGIGGVVTFKKSIMSEVVKKVPLENIVLETDSPYLTPEPNRGKRNESSYIINIAKKIAEIKNIPIEKVEEITTANAIKLFNL